MFATVGGTEAITIATMPALSAGGRSGHAAITADRSGSAGGVRGVVGGSFCSRALTVALLLPVTYGLDPAGSIIMFAGIYYGGMYGGSTTSILLNTPGVSQLVLEGKMFQLPVALDSGRRHGMVPLTDSLAAHVRDGTVQVAEAYRKALDRSALVALLKREGIDTSFAERLA